MDDASDVAQQFISREGWLGFILVVGVALLGYYIWTTEKQTARIAEILQESQELHRLNLQDRQNKTMAISSNTEELRRLREANQNTGEALANLVKMAEIRLEHDRLISEGNAQRAERFIKKIEATKAASERTAAEMRGIRDHIERRDRKIDEEAARRGELAPKQR